MKINLTFRCSVSETFSHDVRANWYKIHVFFSPKPNILFFTILSIFLLLSVIVVKIWVLLFQVVYYYNRYSYNRTVPGENTGRKQCMIHIEYSFKHTHPNTFERFFLQFYREGRETDRARERDLPTYTHTIAVRIVFVSLLSQ